MRELYGYEFEDDVIGCIGIEFSGPKRCEIKSQYLPNIEKKVSEDL